MSSSSLTPREESVLAAIERRLTNPEIAAEQFVSVRTVESHIASLRRKLGVDSRAGLMAAARQRHETSVPLPGNPLRGRDAELRQVAALFETHRWVTVTGPGGVGKTRLALEHARASDRVPVLVALEHADPEDVVARVCRVLGIEPAPGTDPVSALGIALSTQPFLLVLDNADRVGPAVRSTLMRLAPYAPDTRVLITSRTPLGDPDEAVLGLGTLDVEGDDSPALLLLIDRLPATMPLARHERDAAAVVCTRLDGLPLALELAASVARHLSLDELAAQLDQNLSALDRAAPEGRHRTLEAAFDWTWDLLDARDREILSRLGALPVTFDVELATAVTGEDAEPALMRLLDRSLIVPSVREPARYRLLAVLREFVHGRTAPEVIRDVRRLHAEHIARVATAFTSSARRDDSHAMARMSQSLCPEVNSALRWALAAVDDIAQPLATALAIGVDQFGTDLDSVNTLRLAAGDPRFRAEASAETLAVVGNVLSYGDLPLANELAARALEIGVGDDDLMHAHLLAGMVAAYSADPAACDHLDSAEGLARGLGDDWHVAQARQMRGVAQRSAADDPELVLTTFASAVRAYGRAGDAMHVHNARYMMALTAAEAGIRRDEAADWARECAAYAAAAGNPHEHAHADLVLAILGLDGVGELTALHERFRSLGDRRCIGRTLVLQAERLEPSRAVPLLEQAVSLALDAGDRPHAVDAFRRLVDAVWLSGDRTATLAILDRFAGACGTDVARAACPPSLRAEFDADAPETTPEYN